MLITINAYNSRIAIGLQKKQKEIAFGKANVEINSNIRSILPCDLSSSSKFEKLKREKCYKVG
jgi:hypothetical protein